MSIVKAVATDEWRYWRHSKLAISVLLIGLVLLFGSSLLTAIQMTAAAHERQHQQTEAETAFLSQPDRHPHRMVHYGHYAFRTPPPLSIVDPGIDPFTGNSIFLEGHHQNTAMFADRQSSPSIAIFGTLTPALLLQVLAPLLLILIGYNVITREREARTLTQLVSQGVTPVQIMLGKGLALGGVTALLVLPLCIASLFAIFEGEATSVAALFVGGYALYLVTWCAAIVFSSSIMRTPGGSLGVLLATWVVVAMLLPRISSTAATAIVDAPGKIETDFAINEALSKLGDGHNAGDPAFTALRANLLEQYNVDSVEELPVNFRGVVASVSEAELTDTFNQFAEERMRIETDQAQVARLFGWLSPVLGVREFSMKLAGVDLETHHRFLRETEKLRYDFVQSLNKAHAEELSYFDDITRNANADASKQARISSENWKVLDEFRFEPLNSTARNAASLDALIKMLAWLVIVLLLCRTVGRRAI